jgi:hypothetical protein
MREHDFSRTVVREIGQSAMLICQNPDCLCFTGYSSVEGRPRRIAEAAHVLPSGPKGPRASASKGHSQIDPASAANGLWLCKNCHSEIDGDPSRFPSTLLFGWKKEHQNLVGRIVGKDVEAALLNLRNGKRYHQEVRDLLSFFDSRRLLYEGMDAESPPRVLESLDIIRARLVQTRASINPDSDLFPVINSLQAASDRLLRNIGARTDLRSLHCDSRDPKWRKFSDELQKFRSEVSVILRVLAGNAGYQLSNI